MNLGHERDLTRPLLNIILVDTDLVDPEVDWPQRIARGAYCGYCNRADID